MRSRHAWAVPLSLLLAACSTSRSAPATPRPSVSDAGPSRTPPPTATLTPPQDESPPFYATQTDSQGAVVFEVTPVSLSGATGEFDFDVVMNTHSVDLGWDLATRSVLRTDLGREAQALSWPVGSGHHYSGTLSFPGQARDGTALLDGAQVLTLIIRDTDVPERVFTWEVQP